MIAARIRRLDDAVALPSYQTPEATGFDLAARETVRVPPGEVRLVPTGLIVEVPHGYFLGIFARSSTPLRRGLMVANGVGVIDPDYAGPDDEIQVQVVNFTRDEVVVNRGDRIAQGIFIPCAQVQWREGETRDTSRGGFGSTG